LFWVVELLLEAVKKAGIFRRNKVSLRHKVRGCIMYMAGLSYRGMTERTGLIPAGHVAVYYWVKKPGASFTSVSPRLGGL